ncbi:iron chelate uptake ABC transporter family permease subunit [Fulvivirga sedimenti]|uniref:Metal ABC transporter permease n=1 Tax=Fulvivirga sedimenti TaxID=2879465 RepID=A0A9X1KVD2_9BACT|nr:iron chelate uptake ABC transporter family permease subunit [Fulvivirga sedimenti]MCA6074628.1 metal ABC transporter permease [Fulvivirga sedimenti]MCA6075805.1 metal ABC transporter permease [Fulvivirga sedimenti]MCA6076933.1 metal ABC transporter permease [Fulvivirga sedimenti]
MDKDILSFFTFSDPNVRYVVIGAILLTATSAVVGTFTFLKKKALVGDAVAHSVLPGVCLSFLVWGEKNPLILIPGAFATGWLSLVIIDYVRANSKIKEDTAIGLTLSVFFGIGIFLLTIIQKSGNAAQSGLDAFLFGQAASLIGQDLIVFSITAFLLLITVFFLFKELTILAFDADFAATIGIPIRAIELVLTTLTVLAVVIGIQAVGVVLMAAMLITPAAAARFWTENVHVMVILAAIFGAVSGFAGAFISYTAPSMPTGPWIVVVVSAIAFFSFFFAPGKGILHRLLVSRRIRHSMTDENILKTFYNLGERDGNFEESRSLEDLLALRSFEKEELLSGLKRLSRDGFIVRSPSGYAFTTDGMNKGKRTVKLHRLWELYLTQYLRIAPDHVHDDADTIEHILTPELEARLEKLLDYPKVDPHQSEIPY